MKGFYLMLMKSIMIAFLGIMLFFSVNLTYEILNGTEQSKISEILSSRKIYQAKILNKTKHYKNSLKKNEQIKDTSDTSVFDFDYNKLVKYISEFFTNTENLQNYSEKQNNKIKNKARVNKQHKVNNKTEKYFANYSKSKANDELMAKMHQINKKFETKVMAQYFLLMSPSFTFMADSLSDLNVCGKKWIVYIFSFVLGCFWNVKQIKKVGII
jgi:hypothetical protein